MGEWMHACMHECMDAWIYSLSKYDCHLHFHNTDTYFFILYSIKNCVCLTHFLHVEDTTNSIKGIPKQKHP